MASYNDVLFQEVILSHMTSIIAYIIFSIATNSNESMYNISNTSHETYHYLKMELGMKQLFSHSEADFSSKHVLVLIITKRNLSKRNLSIHSTDCPTIQENMQSIW